MARKISLNGVINPWDINGLIEIIDSGDACIWNKIILSFIFVDHWSEQWINFEEYIPKELEGVSFVGKWMKFEENYSKFGEIKRNRENLKNIKEMNEVLEKWMNFGRKWMLRELLWEYRTSWK